MRQVSVVALGNGALAADEQNVEPLDEIARALGSDVGGGQGAPHLVFGAFRSVEDHLERAIRAALWLRGDGGLTSTGFGIASGRISADRAEWEDASGGGVLGGAIALASVSPPGEILVDPTLAALIPDAFVVEEANVAVEADGSLERVPIRVVRTVSARRSRRRRQGRRATSFVGREHQVALFEQALALVESSAGQVVGLVGEPGMGKSRLVEETERAVHGRALWVEGRCSPQGLTHPYLPMIEIVRQICDSASLAGSDSRGRVEAAIARLGAPYSDTPYVLHLIGALGAVEGEDLVRAQSAEALRDRTFAAVRHLVLAAARQQPLVVAVEDLHWADDSSANLLVSLSRAIPAARVLVLATYRPGCQPSWLELSHATQIALPRLRPSEALHVVRSVLEVEEVPEDLGLALLEHGDGNPFFLEELALASQGGELDQDIPGTVEDVIMARIDRLDDDDRALIQTASVLGRRFSLRVLSAVSPGGAPTRASLERIIREEFLVESEVDGDVGYEFRHALTQAVAYRSAGAFRRAATHEAAGLCIESLYAGRTHEVEGLLAHHWSHTEDAARAVAYLDRAAASSARGYAHSEAAATLREALHHAERLPPDERERSVADLSLRLVHSLYFLGRMRESEELLADLGARLDAASDPTLTCAFQFWTGHTASHLGKPDTAERASKAAIDLAEHLNDGAALGLARYIRVRQGWWTGAFRDGVREGREAIPLLEAAGQAWWLGHCHFFVAHSLYSMGRFDEALEEAARGGAIGFAIADPRLKSWAAWAQGLYEAARGNARVAVETCQLGLDLSPDAPNTAWALGAHGFALREKGDLPGAIEDLKRSIELAGRTRHPGILGRFLGWLAEAQRRVGNLEEARAIAKRSGEVAQGMGCRWVAALALRTQGRIASDEGDLDRARRLFGDARAALQAIECNFDLALCQMDIARVAARQGRDPAPALAAADAILKPIPAPAYRDGLAELAAELGVRRGEEGRTSRLTPREREVLALVAEGLTNRQIAERLVISEGTAIRHVSNIFGKLEVNNRAAATRVALDEGAAKLV